MSKDIVSHQLKSALEAVNVEGASTTEKVEMLVEIAMGMQAKPKNAEQLLSAIALYDKALELCPETEVSLSARIQARKGTAFQSISDTGAKSLLQAQMCFEIALNTLEHGTAEELAEIYMNLGLTLQSLVNFHQAKITDAISAYQKSLRTFTVKNFPTEFAIIHNNLATAFLSMPMTDDRAKMREALAVQSFESALEVVSLINQPSEYAMLQNNLGNALQYSSSNHVVENNIRALEAYDEALKVRNAKDMPLEYANTLSNKANCLLNLNNIDEDTYGKELIKDLYQEAREIFSKFHEPMKCKMIDEVLAELR